jgi:uncharacterized protein YutD
MTLNAAMTTYKKFKRPQWDYTIELCKPNSTFGCDFFIIEYSEDDVIKSTSLDLYPEDILEDDYFVLED